MSDDSERDKKRKKGEVEEDKSTPNPTDRAFFAWLAGLFQDEERADWICATQVLGRNKQTFGSIVLRKDIRRDTTPSHEYLVALSNEFIEAMQNEVDACRRTCSFAVTAHHQKRGAEPFARRTITLDPKKLYLGKGEDGEDDDALPNGGDLMRKRMETVLADGRFYAEHVTTSLGGMIQMMLEQLRDKDRMIKDLFDANMSLAKGKNEAENNALDRELVREDKKFSIEAKRAGMTMLQGILPDFFRRMTNGQNGSANGNGHGGGGESSRTNESLAIERVMEGLTEEEKYIVFGEWTDSGTRVKPGILTEAQVRIIVALLKEEVPPSVMDRLLFGPEEISYEQFAAITARVPFVKFKALIDVLREHRERLAQGGGPAETPVPSVPPTQNNVAKEG